ncbi:putative anthocyanidin reductase [Arachis duranensis]|uniref:Anthocyanidin reductase n=1 Tax=Arachis duranensis TaxID=130453 RepID=A0A6P4DR76_ARADU|nr:putative anthocyanidin reductase [Arachis duranensis]
MERRGRRCKVCVTGATGYVGSYLVKKLLEKGYTVHATLRDIKNESKVGILKNIPDSQGKLFLFEADIYNPADFDPAIQGCEFVFHVATPMNHEPGSSQYKNTVEAALAGSKTIFMSCLRSGTVKRLIYTASVVSSSPLKEDGTAFKDFIDETCWTPLNDSLSYVYHDHFLKDYTYSKTLSEKEMLSYNNNENGCGELEVVTIPCGLIGGDTIQSFASGSIALCLSLITGNSETYKTLKFLESLLGKVPLVHIDDVCEAHILCMENSSMKGRFLCASSYVSIAEIAGYYIQHYPEFNVKQEYLEGKKVDVKWGSTKLCEKGFVYKYDTKMILDDTIECGRRIGYL